MLGRGKRRVMEKREGMREGRKEGRWDGRIKRGGKVVEKRT